MRAITNGDGSDSDDSMPSLETASNSSEAETDYDDESDDYDNVDHDGEGGRNEGEDEDEAYDEEDADLLKEFEREAMDAVSAIPDFYNPNAPAPELDQLAEERKGNPFIKLLSALRGEIGYSCILFVISYACFVIGRMFSGEIGRAHV